MNSEITESRKTISAMEQVLAEWKREHGDADLLRMPFGAVIDSAVAGLVPYSIVIGYLTLAQEKRDLQELEAKQKA